ncbi:MAG: hypothetical protein QOD99_3055 [Chthoniobacter sp.]|nr:hypothetical protein [Chthoniobacter sp.]
MGSTPSAGITPKLDPMTDASFRVLLAQDCATDACWIERAVAQMQSPSASMSRAARLDEALSVVAEGCVDLVLLNLTLPDSDGFETFEKYIEHVPHVPVIVLSGIDDEELAVRTVHAGAQDCISKASMDTHLLVRAMRYAIERGHVEQALARQRDVLQSLLDNIPDRVFVKDRESRFIQVNRTMLKMFGMEQQEDVVGKSDFDFFPDIAPKTRADELRVIETGEPIPGQIERKLLPDGGVSWTLTTKLPLRDREGRIIGITGISRDVTELKKMEEELAAERNLLRSVINNLPDPIYVKDAEGHYMLDNVAHTRFLGVPAESQIVGKTVFDFFPTAVAEHFHASDAAIITSGTPLMNHEEIATDSTGNRKWLLTTKVPLRDDSDHVRGLVCIGRDITEQKLADERVRAVNVDLSRALGELQKAHEDLHSIQLQLIEAEKMKSIGRLAAGVAHEVKNPLAIITMGVDYLGQQNFSDDSNVPMILKDMSDAVQRADDVIKGLLDFSAPRKLEVSEEDLNAVIKQSLLLVRGEMTGDGFKVVKELDPDLPRVKLDRGKIGQVFVNLFTNAVHAMGKSGTLLVRSYAKQLTGVGANIGDSRSESFRVGDTVIVVEVDDTGPGVPEDKLTKVFEPFFTTKPTGKGTGLGLSVTRSIVDLHGGTIDIRNRPEGGARITVTFKG